MMEEYLTAVEVAARVRLSLPTIRRYTMLKQIPFHKINRLVRYKPSEIEKWVEEREDKNQTSSLEPSQFVNGDTSEKNETLTEGNGL